MLSGDRAVSLDADGELVLWDTTIRDTGKVGNRFVDTLTTIDDHIRRYLPLPLHLPSLDILCITTPPLKPQPIANPLRSIH